MNTRLMYIFTRTPLHVGAGSSVGAVDMPVQRERHTGFPIIPGSTIKGVLADGYLDENKKRSSVGQDIFGDDDTKNENAKSGSVSFGEGKLLAFPVRSARICFAWLTSPFILKRWMRDSGQDNKEIPEPLGQEVYCGEKLTGKGNKAIFEDYTFDRKGDFPVDLKGVLADQLWQALCGDHMALVSDEYMSHFAISATEVAQHIKIDDEKGVAYKGALFNQENVPAETLFYSVLTELRPNVLTKLSVPAVLQIGGNATTGLGYCSVEVK